MREITLPQAKQILLLAGAPRSRRKSFYQAALAVLLAARDENLLEGPSKELFARVELLSGGSPGTAERNIRGLVALCWDQGGRESFLALTGLDYEARPTASQFIGALANCLRRRAAGLPKGNRPGRRRHP